MKKAFERIFTVPAGINIELNGNEIIMHYGGKTLAKKFEILDIKLEKVDGNIKLSTEKANRKNIAKINTLYTKLKNMAIGLLHGFEYRLEIVYSHFPINVSVKGPFVEISNLCGRKKPVKAKIIGDVKVEVKGKDIFVRGYDKEAVGQTAANLENITRLKGRDVRIFNDGIYLAERKILGKE